MSNRLIVIEGLDGTGKSTLISSLCKQLDATLISTPPEMFDSRISEGELREFFDATEQSRRREYYRSANFLASELALIALEKSHVIMDRYWPSTAAFSAMDESNPEWEELGTFPKGFVRPDAIILLTVSEEERENRIKNRGELLTDEEIRLSSQRENRQRVLEGLRAFGPIEIDTTNLDPQTVLQRALIQTQISNLILK